MTNQLEGMQGDNWQLDFESSNDAAIILNFAGDWSTNNNLPSPKVIFEKLASTPNMTAIGYTIPNLTKWDSGFLTFISNLDKLAKAQSIAIQADGLSKNIRTLLDLSTAVPEKKSQTEKKPTSLLYLIGHHTIETVKATSSMIEFIGALTINFMNLLRGKSKFLWSDLFYFIQDCGINALPIVLIICFLIGLILAFIGAVQLQAFGAGIYVANLVAIGVTREMSPLMIAIILSGRTGASYAAQIGSMQANEEIDALRTTVISPIDFLVMPRMIALILMIPLLCIYGDFIGMAGGMMIGVSVLHLSVTEYIQQTMSAITMVDIMIGVVKSVFFGLLIAIAGCYQGLHCGRSADAVGSATTTAVVSAILFVIISDAMFEIIINILNI